MQSARADRSPDAAKRHQRVYARLRRAISAFTRVFDALWRRGALQSGGQRAVGSVVGSGSAEQREARCTASGTRAEFALAAVQVDRGVESPLQKYFGFHTPQITSRTFRIPSHTEGRFAIVTDVGHGMRWTRQRLVRDGIAGRVERPVSDQQHADERRCYVRRSRVVLTPRRWRQGCGYWVGPTGRGHNISPQTTVAKEPGHRGEHEVSRKAIACGDAGRFRCTRCYSCAFHHYQAHTRPRVQRAPGIPHALLGGGR